MMLARWVRAGLLSAVFISTMHADDGFKDLFDGKSLAGWQVQGGTATYRIEDDCIVGKTTDGSPNTFLCKGPFGDFDLRFEVKCEPRLNSGVQIRSQLKNLKPAKCPFTEKEYQKGDLSGYQCEIADNGTSGNFWDENRRNKWLGELSPAAKTAFKLNEWNKYRIVAQKDRIRSWINDVPCADFTDSTDATGVIGLQVHGIGKGEGPYEVRWRKLRIKELSADDKVD